MKAKPNPLHARWLAALNASPRLFLPWAGHAFRFGNLKYCEPGQILGGMGSYKFGGRYNAAGSFKASYHSLTKATAVAESDANALYYGLAKDVLRPRLLVAVELRLQRVLDFTRAPVRHALGISAAEITGENWREMRDAGRESRTQALGRAAFDSQAEAVLAPSACVKDGVNLVVFPENLRDGSVFQVCNAEELEHLQ